MDAKELKALSIDLMDAVRQRNLSAFSLKCEDFQIRIEAQQAPVAVAAPAVAVAAPAAAAAPQAQPAAASPVEESFSGTPVEAPLVGIFYSAPAPEEPPFIEVGQQVKKGDTLFIIEAMKTMNEITAPCDGTVSRILAQNGDMVEYKQVLVVIE
ncbi:acetyl-CoA carboxylase biotin carboxyl carrier protein [Butyricicoccus pullicaecorum]|uniref:Biotin carboxyl carrier protein of acetyl-CoA carboxylase n=2 Tax=Butyricicoccus pullicaecorum TaxID=501571 RepID=R8W5A5_9FIRM|nr:acetyl-CoA carboxylase biotin carboxyl carrier protein [Butyricicoccus pullicaecorum]EOQ39736.1 acetyl-CoA carboxylase, biotin carboxyl carrier protein [Butyricicoccus pullicaecorum 1.2]OUP53796.1 acetyl-CoA carboxylase biotin carboxyl carrier protein subunit [Butyricicoccus pullicaecorum]SKA57128.1 acetyl-CoA carboxylase biotin carboxyl carrier protein [Butyricicoccus pullicaecorum DSM 23266]